MLTDDDLTTRLRADFDHATADLHYTGRVPTPRPRAALVLAPTATLVGAAAVGAVVLGQPSAAPRPPAVTVAPETPTTTVNPATPSEAMAHLRLAGFRFSFPRREADHLELARIVFDPVPVPADARALPARDGAKAWVAPYPGSVHAGLWVQTPGQNGGRPVALVPNDWGVDRLAQLWSTGVKLPSE